MPITNEHIRAHDFLRGMYRDDDFPNFLVDRTRTIMIELSEAIERDQPGDEASRLVLTHAATEAFNALQQEFKENDSELETEAREVMGANFEFILRAYGFADVDIQDIIAPIQWQGQQLPLLPMR